MPVFRYRVAQTNGTTQEGQAEGESEGMVRAQLEGQGFLVFQLRRQDSWAQRSTAPSRSRGKVSSQEFLIFNQELLALTKAGLPILKIWDLLIDRARHPAFRDVLGMIRQAIRGGASASEALAQHPVHFSDLYIASIKAGEQSGNLPEVLQRYIQHLKLIIALRQKIVKALAYPGFLVIMSILVILFMLLFVIPTFTEVYAHSKRALPMGTQVLLTVVDGLQGFLLPGLLSLGLFGIIFSLWYKTPSGRVRGDKVLLSLPWVGNLLQKQYAIQLTRTLATILSGGTPLVEALNIARGAVGNRHLMNGLARAGTQIREGAPLAASLGQHNILPPVALEMVAIGEETGSLEIMLQDVAEFYEGDLDFRLGQMTTWIETVMLLVMGVIIGAIVVVMYLPVFEMAGNI